MHKPGSILKVSVNNFITYKNIEFVPGPSLNLILGPNGTGKSTIIAAIILGLGGTPKDVGRGTHISEYVRHHCEIAKINITLQGEKTNSEVLITREFNIFNKNIWRINNKAVSKDDVMKCVHKFKIQVNNLCQFLPQDRVQDFAKLNKQQLLKETQVALCRVDLVNLYDNACKYSTLYLKKREDVTQIEKALENMVSKQAALAPKIENLKLKEQHISQIKDIERKIAWIKYKEFEDEYNVKLQDMNSAQELIDKIQKQRAAFPHAIANANTLLKSITIKLQNSKTIINNSVQDGININRKIESLKEDIQKIESERDSCLNTLQHVNNDITLLNIDIKQLTQKQKELIESHGEENDLNERSQIAYGNIQKIKTNIITRENSKNKFIHQRNELLNELKFLKDKQLETQNVYKQKLHWLQRQDEDAYNATMWLENNKDKFSSDIYKPMILELNVFEAQHAIYFENTIAMRERIAFTCTSIEDMNKFMRLMEEEIQLKVNVVYSDPNTKITDYQPNIPIEQLSKYGFHSYLSSLCEGPEPIMTYLCQNYRLHSVPIGNEVTHQYLDRIPQIINTFFIEKLRFSIRFSTYTGEKITSQSEIRSDGSFSMIMNTMQDEYTKGKINSFKNQLESIEENIAAIKNEIRNLLSQETKLTEEINLIEKMKLTLKSLKKDIEIKNKRLVEKQNLNKNSDEIKEEAAAKIRVLIIKMTEYFTNYQKIKENCFKPSIFINFLAKKVETTRKDVLILENKLQDLNTKEIGQLSILNRIKYELQEIASKLATALKNAKHLTNGLDETSKEFSKFKNIFKNLPNSIDELLSKKETLLSLANLLNTAEINELDEYEKLLKNIEETKLQINEQNFEKNQIHEEMIRCSEEWLKPLNNFIEEINEKFCNYFRKIGCVGEVSLFTNDNVEDYTQYGLMIKVSFRSNLPMQELSSRVHSGGERAVTTALFMLSLQHLTPVPFRCVDEINQGMDETNERLVYKLLFQITEDANSAQYFVVTPKLLSKLEYTKSMNIHVIYVNKAV